MTDGLDAYISNRFYNKRYNDNDIKQLTYKNLIGKGVLTKIHRMSKPIKHNYETLRDNTVKATDDLFKGGAPSIPLPPQIDLSIYATKSDLQEMMSALDKFKLNNDEVYLNLRSLSDSVKELNSKVDVLKNDDIKLYGMIKDITTTIPQLKSTLSNVEYYINHTADRYNNFKSTISKFK